MSGPLSIAPADAEDRIVSELRRIDPDSMTPMEALQLLAELRKRLDSSD